MMERSSSSSSSSDESEGLDTFLSRLTQEETVYSDEDSRSSSLTPTAEEVSHFLAYQSEHELDGYDHHDDADVPMNEDYHDADDDDDINDISSAGDSEYGWFDETSEHLDALDSLLADLLLVGEVIGEAYCGLCQVEKAELMCTTCNELYCVKCDGVFHKNRRGIHSRWHWTGDEKVPYLPKCTSCGISAEHVAHIGGVRHLCRCESSQCNLTTRVVTVFDLEGPKLVIFELCSALDEAKQMLALGFFPASTDRVAVVFTLSLLHLCDSFQMKALTMHRFIKAIQHYQQEFIQLEHTPPFSLESVKKLLQLAIHSMYHNLIVNLISSNYPDQTA